MILFVYKYSENLASVDRGSCSKYLSNFVFSFFTIALPSNFSQSRSGLTFKLVSQAPSIVGIFTPNSLA
jgi:hypothetical protein